MPVAGLTLIGHVGRLNVSGKLNEDFSPSAGVFPSATDESTNPDYTDWKIGVSKAFKIANADGWNAGVYYVGNDNGSYWGSRGYGGSSFNGSSQTKDLSDGRVIGTLGRSF
jgi:hypothetical protein